MRMLVCIAAILAFIWLSAYSLQYAQRKESERPAHKRGYHAENMLA